MTITFESLPVELIADILSELDLESLIKLSYLSRRLHYIASDSSLNPWRAPILRNLRSNSFESCLKHLSVRSIPRQNWVEILSIAPPAFLLFESTLPNLKAAEWEECFRRRFLPGWRKWKKDGEWKAVFLNMLYRLWHRSHTTCTADEAWTKYIVLNRNGSANELETSARLFNPLSLFNEMKLQSNLAHLETRVRLVVEFADVRILAFGTLNKPRSQFYVNPNAHVFLHPPGIDVEDTANIGESGHRSGTPLVSEIYPNSTPLNVSANSSNIPTGFHIPSVAYTRLNYPLPAPSHAKYPFHTAGGGDKRWLGSGEVEEEGLQWVGGLMIIAQILGPNIHTSGLEWPPLQDLDLVVGPGRNQYASFTWPDLWAIAPWMEERITKKIDGPGLGN